MLNSLGHQLLTCFLLGLHLDSTPFFPRNYTPPSKKKKEVASNCFTADYYIAAVECLYLQLRLSQGIQNFQSETVEEEENRI